MLIKSAFYPRYTGHRSIYQHNNDWMTSTTIALIPHSHSPLSQHYIRHLSRKMPPTSAASTSNASPTSS